MIDVRCPVLAIFGENDIVQPTETSAALFEEYLTAAGNNDFEIIVMPGEGHDINGRHPATTRPCRNGWTSTSSVTTHGRRPELRPGCCSQPGAMAPTSRGPATSWARCSAG